MLTFPVSLSTVMVFGLAPAWMVTEPPPPTGSPRELKVNVILGLLTVTPEGSSTVFKTISPFLSV
jgi:hypothetical protein